MVIDRPPSTTAIPILNKGRMLATLGIHSSDGFELFSHINYEVKISTRFEHSFGDRTFSFDEECLCGIYSQLL